MGLLYLGFFFFLSFSGLDACMHRFGVFGVDKTIPWRVFGVHRLHIYPLRLSAFRAFIIIIIIKDSAQF
jgi:hypothetical protein